MFLKLLALFTVIPAVELVVLIALGRSVGFWPTAALVLVTGVLGAWLARREGLKVFFAVQAEVAQGRMPTDQLLDGLMIVVAGAVLLTPGLLTDAFGFLLLVPTGRKAIKAAVTKALAGRVQVQGPVTLDGEWTRVD